ncbi:MAG: SPASM domain-containing protein, partial [Flavobacteriales bacterium]|nr:SPASM domain-containing protein [Flavobacteriales bacterium]
QTFREVWHSEAYTEFRRTLLTARSSIEMCRNCSEGSPVWA